MKTTTRQKEKTKLAQRFLPPQGLERDKECVMVASHLRPVYAEDMSLLSGMGGMRQHHNADGESVQ